jgi:hypothetical protein
MNTKSILVRSIGVLQALLVFVSLPVLTARANMGTCDDVVIYWEYGTGTNIYFELTVANPTGATIFFTTTLDDPNVPDPTHNFANPTGTTLVGVNGTRVPIDLGHTRYIKAIAWKSSWAQSPHISCGNQHNPNG